MSQGRKSIRLWITAHQRTLFPLLAFVVPVAIRIIPEVLMGQYTIGFDTMGYYVPNAILFQHGVNVSYLLSIAPLFYIFYTSLVVTFGSPVFLLKILSPLILGLLALSIFLFAKKGLRWSATKSTCVSILGTVYFVALRASSDQLREELSLVFLFFILTSLVNRKDASWRSYALISVAMFSTVLSDQIGATITFGIVLLTLLGDFLHRQYGQTAKLVVASLPAAAYFITFYWWYVSTAGFPRPSDNVSVLYSWTGFASYESMLTNEAGLFLFCFLPLLPLVILGFKRCGNIQIRFWLVFSLILMIVPLSVSPYRWILILIYPLSFYAIDGISALKNIRWKRFQPTAQKIAISYLILSTAILSLGFIFMTTEKPFIYFSTSGMNSYVNQIPSSLLQNTVPLSDCQSTSTALQWFKANADPNSVLLTHAAFYGWALMMLDNNKVYDYGFENPDKAAATVNNQTHAQLYLIWWTDGNGWYGLPTVPQQFHEVYQSGQIAIYRYSSS